jgi:hypothetical protein
MTEYAFNAIIFAFTEIFAFMTNYDFELRMSFDSINSSESARERIMQFKEVNIAEKMQKMIDFTKRKLAITQESQKRHVDSKRAKALVYKKDDLVWLSTKNIKITRLSKKLNWKMIDSYRIKKMLDASCQLDLSDSMKIHDIFHFSLLRKTSNDSLLDQILKPSSSMFIDEKEEYELNDVLNFRKIEKKKKLQYKISWKNYSSDPTWYSAKNFENSKKILIDFHLRYSIKSH